MDKQTKPPLGPSKAAHRQRREEHKQKWGWDQAEPKSATQDETEPQTSTDWNATIPSASTTSINPTDPPKMPKTALQTLQSARAELGLAIEKTREGLSHKDLLPEGKPAVLALLDEMKEQEATLEKMEMQAMLASLKK